MPAVDNLRLRPELTTRSIAEHALSARYRLANAETLRDTRQWDRMIRPLSHVVIPWNSQRILLSHFSVLPRCSSTLIFYRNITKVLPSTSSKSKTLWPLAFRASFKEAFEHWSSSSRKTISIAMLSLSMTVKTSMSQSRCFEEEARRLLFRRSLKFASSCQMNCTCCCNGVNNSG